MNRPPEILINNGFRTDQNGVLDEVVIPNNVTTLNVPSIVTTYATTINWLPSNAATLVEFNAPNLSSISNSFFSGFTNLNRVTMDGIGSIGTLQENVNVSVFKNCTNLEYVKMNSLTFLGSSVGAGQQNGIFYGCTNLKNVLLPSLTQIVDTGRAGSGYNSFCGTFYNCTSLESVAFNNLIEIKGYDGGTSGVRTIGTFYGCSALKTVSFPLLVEITHNGSTGGTFYNCTALEDVIFGSEGHAVTSIASNTFTNCTQSGLTITIYTQGGAALAGEPWGATGADIEYEEA